MRGWVFLIIQTGRKVSRMGLAFVVLMAVIFSVVIGRFLAIRFDGVDASSVLDSSVEWASWLDFGAEILVVLPFVLFALMMMWGRYGSRMLLDDLDAHQQAAFNDAWNRTGPFSVNWFMLLSAIFGWFVVPVLGIVVLYYITRIVFGF